MKAPPGPAYNRINRNIHGILSEAVPDGSFGGDDDAAEAGTACSHGGGVGAGDGSTGAGTGGGTVGPGHPGQLVVWTDHVKDYDWLLGNLLATNVAIDVVYQKRYRDYWRMNAARLPPGYVAAYFNFLEIQKRNSGLFPDMVCNALVGAAPSLQFSFATKLAHMVRPCLPLYDSKVATFYDFPYPAPAMGLANRIAVYMESYDYLVDEYRRIRSCGLLAPSIAEFRRCLSPKTMTDEKIIDSLIWAS